MKLLKITSFFRSLLKKVRDLVLGRSSPKPSARQYIEIVPYNPNWPILFEAESKLIQEALGENCLAVHHIGSTAVPGLVARPQIDIIAVVQDPSQVEKQLSNLGFQYKGESNIPFRYGFSKRGNVDVKLHVYEEDHPEIELNLVFRDYLRSHERGRELYAWLKRYLATDEASLIRNGFGFTLYTLSKGVFIRRILKQAGFNRLRMLQCSDQIEWKVAHRFRNNIFEPMGGYEPYKLIFSIPTDMHLILYQGADIIGYAHIAAWTKKRAALYMIVIDEAKRGQHVGSQFLKLCEKWLKHQGMKSIHVAPQTAAMRFYTKNGYKDMPWNGPIGMELKPHERALGKIL